MKILDWMHRKLHPATKYSRVCHTNKAPAFEHDVADRIDPAHRSSPVGTELDTETPLLLHVNLAGILTIGTLGYSHPLFLPHLPEEPLLKEIQPAAKPPEQITLLQPAAELFVIKTEQSVVEVHVEEKVMAEPLLKEDRERKKRTTLADLLAVERAVNCCDQSHAVTGPTKSAPASDLKKGSKEKNKKKKNKKGDELESSQLQSPAATERIHRMITRMVRKKIHPEAAATGRKGGGAAVVEADLFRGGDAA